MRVRNGWAKEEVGALHHPYPVEVRITLTGETLPQRGCASRVKSLGLGYVPEEQKPEEIVGHRRIS